MNNLDYKNCVIELDGQIRTVHSIKELPDYMGYEIIFSNGDVTSIGYRKWSYIVKENKVRFKYLENQLNNLETLNQKVTDLFNDKDILSTIDSKVKKIKTEMSDILLDDYLNNEQEVVENAESQT